MSAIDNLTRKDKCPNLVTVLKHGCFDERSYYIDMELCEGNLQDYIEARTHMTYLSDSSLSVFGEELDDAPRIWTTRDIMEQIREVIDFNDNMRLLARGHKR